MIDVLPRVREVLGDKGGNADRFRQAFAECDITPAHLVTYSGFHAFTRDARYRISSAWWSLKMIGSMGWCHST